ncbi:ChaN family lipoprotein [Luteimonas sp. e5]
MAGTRLLPRFIRMASGTALAALLLACASAPPAASTAREILLLGEVHDNPAVHEARLALLRERIEAGWRPAIAMEQFDVGQQATLTAAQARCADADCVIEQAGAGSGWQWPLYRPLIELALQHRLPLLAANLSRNDAAVVMKDGFAAVLDEEQILLFGLDRALPADVLAAQAHEVREGHCGMLPEAMVEPMARAQVARDVVMADVLLAHAGDVVLIAGNGHVRRDIGVPFWLRTRTDARVRSIGFGESPATQFDQQQVLPAHPRPDPCAAFR